MQSGKKWQGWKPKQESKEKIIIIIIIWSV